MLQTKTCIMIDATSFQLMKAYTLNAEMFNLSIHSLNETKLKKPTYQY